MLWITPSHGDVRVDEPKRMCEDGFVKLTHKELRERVGNDEAKAYELLEELRWPDGPECPHCGHDKAYFLTPKNPEGRRSGPSVTRSIRRVWKCAKCRKQFSVLTGTIFHGTKVPLCDWLTVMLLVSSAKNGISAREVERQLGVTPETAWFMLHRLREAMRRESILMDGVIVADEAWIGGEPRFRHKGHRDDRGGGNRRTDKTPIVALVEKHTGEARARVVPNVTGQTLGQVMKEERVDPERSILWTDENPAYDNLGMKFVDHETVLHDAEEYVNAQGASTNLAEGFFSQLKRSIDGTYHHVSREHLQRYLDEFSFRYSTRKLKDSVRLQRIVDQAKGRRLSYKPLTGATK